MKRYYLFITAIFFIMVCLTHGQDLKQTFQVIACKDASLARGDSLHRAVYFISLPENYSRRAFLRIFDADLGDHFDQWAQKSQVSYRVFGKGNIDYHLWNYDESLSGKQSILEVNLAKSKYYDNRWRTMGELPLFDADVKEGRKIFQLVVDGDSGSARNLYQLFISAEEKRNTTIEGIKITTPSICIRLPETPALVAHLRFSIPENTDTIFVYNFDSDFKENKTEVFFESAYRQRIPVLPTQDGKYSVTPIPVIPEEKGNNGAILIANNHSVNNIQLWIKGQDGSIIPFELPTLIASPNHLPQPKIDLIPLSQCFTMVMDASGTVDEDGDDLLYKWTFPDGTVLQGSRIVHDFGKAGKYDILLTVEDNSGFVANTSRLEKEIIINDPPRAVITAADKGVPGTFIRFDGSLSEDSDGEIINYIWDFGDGTSGKGKEIQHRFTRPGTYIVTLNVEDNGKSLCSKDRAKHKIWINDPPMAKINAKTLAAIDEKVTFSAEGSIDSDGELREFLWDFGDGNSASGIKVSHQWKDAGKFHVRLTVVDDADLPNSKDIDEMDIVINAPPVPLAKFPPVVSASETVLFSAEESKDTDGQIIGYVWKFGDGGMEEGAKVSHNFQKPGVYDILLRTIDNSGALNNQSEESYKIRVNYPPSPDFVFPPVVNSSAVKFDASPSADKDDEIIQYSWNFGDGVKGNGKIVEHIYALPGTYNVELKVTDASGTSSASRSMSKTVRVNRPPIADAGGNHLIAPGESVKLDAGFSEDVDGKIVTYEWVVSDGRKLSGSVTECPFSTPGKYVIDLKITDNDGAVGIDHAEVTVNFPPEPFIYPVSRVAPETDVLFDGSGSIDIDGKIISAEWDFGDGTAPRKGLKVTHQFREPGRYQVRLTVKDDSRAVNNTNSFLLPVEVNFPPVPELEQDILTCNQMVIFDASRSRDSDGDLLTYHWDFGDGNKGNGKVINHKYLSSGIYPVTLTVDDGQKLANSVSKIHTKVLINTPPIAVINVNRTTLCAGEPAIFDASDSRDPEEGLLRFLWDFGDGEKAEGINPVHSFPGGGDYNVRLTVMDDSNLPCNSTIVEKIIHVIDAPVARAGEDITTCANAVVQFDASASSGGGRQIQGYEWDFGDGKSGGGVQTTHIYANPGIYKVYLRITVPVQGDCDNSSEDELTVNVIAAPSASFSVKEEGCPGEEIIFDASSSTAGGANIVEYSWDFGDGSSGSGEKVSHLFPKPGDYTVKLKVRTDSEQGCNTADYSRMVSINAKPVARIQMAKADTGYKSLSEISGLVHEFIRFSAISSEDPDGYIASYQWNLGDGTDVKGAVVRHQYDKPGEYLVSLKTTDNSHTGCNRDSSTAKVIIKQLPVLQVQSPSVTCVDEDVTFKAEFENGAGISPTELEWTFSDGKTGAGESFTRQFHLPGKYQAQVKWRSVCSDAAEIVVFKMPEIQLPEKLEAYPGDKIRVKPEYTNPYGIPLAFHWDFEGVEKVDKEEAKVVFNKPGDFTVRLVVKSETSGCAEKEYLIPVKIYTPPEAEIQLSRGEGFSGGARDEVGFSAVIKAERDNWIFQWDFGDGGKTVGKTALHSYQKPGKYKVTLTLKDATHLTEQEYTFGKVIEIKSR